MKFLLNVYYLANGGEIDKKLKTLTSLERTFKTQVGFKSNNPPAWHSNLPAIQWNHDIWAVGTKKAIIHVLYLDVLRRLSEKTYDDWHRINKWASNDCRQKWRAFHGRYHFLPRSVTSPICGRVTRGMKINAPRPF